MENTNWPEQFPAGITVCDREGIVLEINEKAALTFRKQGGKALIGANLLDCHPGASRDKLLSLLESGKTNAYTIEKNGVKKLIYQAPWHRDGEYRGFVELSLELPPEMPHFVRS